MHPHRRSLPPRPPSPGTESVCQLVTLASHTLVQHVIMCRPWMRQLLAKADPVNATGSRSKITAMWSSCYQHSAAPTMVRLCPEPSGGVELAPRARPRDLGLRQRCTAVDSRRTWTGCVVTASSEWEGLIFVVLKN